MSGLLLPPSDTRVGMSGKGPWPPARRRREGGARLQGLRDPPITPSFLRCFADPGKLPRPRTSEGLRGPGVHGGGEPASRSTGVFLVGQSKLSESSSFLGGKIKREGGRGVRGTRGAGLKRPGGSQSR